MCNTRSCFVIIVSVESLFIELCIVMIASVTLVRQYTFGFVYDDVPEYTAPMIRELLNKYISGVDNTVNLSLLP